MRRGDIVYLKETGELIKKRPFIVVSNDLGNRFSDVIIVVPLTSKVKRLEMGTHCVVDFNQSMVLAEQIYTIDQSEVERVAYRLNEEDMKKVDKCLLVSLGVSLKVVANNDRII